MVRHTSLEVEPIIVQPPQDDLSGWVRNLGRQACIVKRNVSIEANGRSRWDLLDVSLKAKRNLVQLPQTIENAKADLPGNSLFLSCLPNNTLGGIRHRWRGDVQLVSSSQWTGIHETRNVCEDEKSDRREGNHVQ